MLNDAPGQCPPARKRTVSVGKVEEQNLPAVLPPPPAKILRVATDSPKTSTQTRSSPTGQYWPQTVQQPISSFTSGTVFIPDYNQVKWHQPSTETDPFSVAADLDQSFASMSYPSSSCTPLAPISELLSPQQFTSYDLQAAGVLSPSSCVSLQMGHSLTTLSSLTPLDGGSDQSTVETYAEAGSASAEPQDVGYPTSTGVEGSHVQGPRQWTPGWSMLRQMLSQSHHENALMHGVLSSDGQLDPPPQSLAAEYMHGGGVDDRLLQSDAAAAQQFISAAITDDRFSRTASQQGSANTSDVLYVQMTSDTDDALLIQHPAQLTADDAEAGTQQQLVITAYTEVAALEDLNTPKTVPESDNNNESVTEEKNV